MGDHGSIMVASLAESRVAAGTAPSYRHTERLRFRTFEHTSQVLAFEYLRGGLQNMILRQPKWREALPAEQLLVTHICHLSATIIQMN